MCLMGLKYDLIAACIGFIDCMFGFATFIYLNIADYRHIKIGNHEEIYISYACGLYGFFKGLALCIPVAQVMVNQGKAVWASRSVIIWYLLSFIQLAVFLALIYYFVWPMNSEMGNDVFLFVLRIVHIVFLLISVIYLYKFRSSLSTLIPSRVVKKPPVPRWKARKSKRTSASHAADANTEADPERDNSSGE